MVFVVRWLGVARGVLYFTLSINQSIGPNLNLNRGNWEVLLASKLYELNFEKQF